MSDKKNCWLRARRPDQKAQRRGSILETAGELFDADGYDGVSLNGIARAVGLAKSNLYRYFQSKEEIFLTLLEEAHRAWVDEAELALEELGPSAAPATIGAELARTLAARPRLCALAAIVSSVLERNVSVERVVEHKNGSIALLMRLMGSITTANPGLQMEQAGTFLRLAYALVTGLWPAANPPSVVQDVLSKPQFSMLRTDFELDLADGLTHLLVGLIAESSP